MINIPYPSQKILDDFFEIQKVEILKRIKAIKKTKQANRLAPPVTNRIHK